MRCSVACSSGMAMMVVGVRRGSGGMDKLVLLLLLLLMLLS